MHIALYRKYRPATFDDVVGQGPITATLRSEVAAGTPAHAYLFTGSRGTGKTSCAKILAKALNCLHPVDGNPCGECELCRGIDEGSVLDVVEIDAASNNGVDNIRDLRDEANFTPAMGRYRVYIIDEAHMLSTGAFNALLKIMEEPPAHVVFILATTEVHKIPATILSRCQRFDFYRIAPGDMAERLSYIADQEGFTITEEAAALIARLSDGALRDAISLLDLCASHNSRITMEVVTEASGTVGRGHLFALADAIADEQIAQALTVVEELAQRSLDAGRLCEQLIGHFRDLMLARAMSDIQGFVDATPADCQLLQAQAARFSMERILYSLRVLQDTFSRLNRTSAGRSELEVALVTLCSPMLSGEQSALLARIEALEAALRTGRFSAAGAEAPKPAVHTPESPVTPPDVKAPIEAGGEQIVPKSAPNAEVGTTEAAEPEAEKLQNWPEILAALARTNAALYGALQSSTAYRRGNYVLIDCRDDFFLKLMRENAYAKDCLKQAILQVTGNRCNIGPYRRADKQPLAQTDPLNTFLANLDLPEDKVVIE